MKKHVLKTFALLSSVLSGHGRCAPIRRDGPTVHLRSGDTSVIDLCSPTRTDSTVASSKPCVYNQRLRSDFFLCYLLVLLQHSFGNQYSSIVCIQYVLVDFLQSSDVDYSSSHGIDRCFDSSMVSALPPSVRFLPIETMDFHLHYITMDVRLCRQFAVIH
jgi:hypothetical protein